MGKRTKRALRIITFATILLALGFAVGQYYLDSVYQRQVEYGYRRSLMEFATHFQELTNTVGQARMAQSTKQKELIAANLRRLIYAAQNNLAELPLGELPLERTSQLLAHLYEQTYSYAAGQIEGGTFDQHYEQVEHLNSGLKQMLVAKESEFPWVSWHEYLTTSVARAEWMQALALINDELKDMGGPVRKGEITGEPITRKQAIETAILFSERSDLNFQVTTENKGPLSTYRIEGRDAETEIILEISQKGGLVLWMIVAKEVTETQLEPGELVLRGASFLEAKGFHNLHITDVQMLQNKATLTFVPLREGILRYTEPLRVQVSAFDGSILGFWGTAYHLAQSRNQPEAQEPASVDWEIDDRLRAGSVILDQKPAFILNSQQDEVLVTRLGVQYQEDYYLIYLNAETGDEEQIIPVRSGEFF